MKEERRRKEIKGGNKKDNWEQTKCWNGGQKKRREGEKKDVKRKYENSDETKWWNGGKRNRIQREKKDDDKEEIR